MVIKARLCGENGVKTFSTKLGRAFLLVVVREKAPENYYEMCEIVSKFVVHAVEDQSYAQYNGLFIIKSSYCTSDNMIIHAVRTSFF